VSDFALHELVCTTSSERSIQVLQTPSAFIRTDNDIYDAGPKFGKLQQLAVMVDGARVGSVTEGHAYNGTLTPGQHTISVSGSGPERGTSPTKTITAQAGQTYTLTAVWQGKHLTLQ